ncbi:MAG TPA: nitrile hydratase subunit alpha [Vicinamibacterales bacterium]|nr:nitrile hydratase subunit alpha [Vicinamibacterales bacterium]
MTKADDGSVDRRGFLKGAAAGAAGFAGAPHAHTMQDGHDHDHDHQVVPADIALRVKAIESLLVDKGLVDRAALDAIVEAFETKIGPRNGARVVARAWADPAYKKRLLANAGAAIAELGFSKHQDEDMVVLENTPKVHNLVVCTLCSCYPWPVLGLPPVWYKSAPYRSRAVIDPRGVLKEFGLELDAGIEVRVWDSTAEIRYLVLPERPAGTEHMTEEQLADLVTRDSMIGTAKVDSHRSAEASRSGGSVR